MYCVSCGVELQQGAQACPLCGLRPYHPEITECAEPKPYPRYTEADQRMSRTAIMLIVSMGFVIPAVLCLLTDLWVNGRVRWSGYAVGGIAVAYCAFLLPHWFRKPNPVVFFPVAVAAAELCALYVCAKTGGRWFLPFALPAGGALMALIECVIVLTRYVVRRDRRRFLIVYGSAGIAFGLFLLLLEFLLHVAFRVPMLWWSTIPLTAFVLLGGTLLTVGLCRPLSEALHKRFFI